MSTAADFILNQLPRQEELEKRIDNPALVRAILMLAEEVKTIRRDMATKSDVQTVATSVEGVVAAWKTGNLIGKCLFWLGGIAASFTAIIMLWREISRWAK